jgi:hypothetical protein
MLTIRYSGPGMRGDSQTKLSDVLLGGARVGSIPGR